VDLRGIELAISQPEAIGHKSDVVDNSVVNIDSESESGSTSSGDTSRSRSRSRDRANKRLGAAAATALVTATIPFDVEECDRIVERELALPTAFAMQLQHEGGLVAVMADTGTVVGVTPKDSQQSVLSISGYADTVSRAIRHLEELYAAHVESERAAASAAAERAETENIEWLEIPVEYLSAVVGPNGSGIAEVRERCSGIMVALQPSTEPGGPMTAFIGPGCHESVLLAKHELRQRMQFSETSEGAAADARALEILPAELEETALGETGKCGSDEGRELSGGMCIGPGCPSGSHLLVPQGPPESFAPPDPVLSTTAGKGENTTALDATNDDAVDWL